MQLQGEMNLQGLALLGNVQPGGEGTPAMTMRMLDADGDGRTDLFLVDLDSDGTIDGVVRGFDADGDGVNETFVQYDAEGSISAVGRLDPETREFDVVYEAPEGFDAMLSSYGLAGLEVPDDALFTSFDDPYIGDTYGSFGEDVPDAFETEYLVADAAVAEVDATDEAAAGGGADIVDDSSASASDTTSSSDSGGAADSSVASDAAPAEAEPGETPPEVVARVTEIEDWSGAGDGSDLHAKIDTDADGLGDTDERLFKTSDGTWHGDVNRDGYSDEVAFDRDTDGKIESVDTTGEGSSTNVVGAEQVVDPQNENIVDRHPGEDDIKVEEEQAAADSGAGAADDGAASDIRIEDADDAGAMAAGSEDAGDADDSSAASTADDSAGSYDSGSSNDPGSGSSSDSTDYGSTTTDSGSSSSDDDDGSTTT